MRGLGGRQPQGGETLILGGSNWQTRQKRSNRVNLIYFLLFIMHLFVVVVIFFFLDLFFYFFLKKNYSFDNTYAKMTTELLQSHDVVLLMPQLLSAARRRRVVAAIKPTYGRLVFISSRATARSSIIGAFCGQLKQVGYTFFMF